MHDKKRYLQAHVFPLPIWAEAGGAAHFGRLQELAHGRMLTVYQDAFGSRDELCAGADGRAFCAVESFGNVDQPIEPLLIDAIDATVGGEAERKMEVRAVSSRRARACV